MAQESLSATAIADFLAENPDFFETNAELFASLKVPHPYKSQAISLGERQILTLRARLKNSETQLQSLVYNASGNQKINQDVIQWCTKMLAEQNAKELPQHIIDSLAEQFFLDSIALKTWELPQLSDSSFTQGIDAEAINFANSLPKPYCGAPENTTIAGWLAGEPQSIAILPLKNGSKTKSIGLLVFGSEDPERFSADMGTDFLQLIANLAGAALSRLEKVE